MGCFFMNISLPVKFEDHRIGPHVVDGYWPSVMGDSSGMSNCIATIGIFPLNPAPSDGVNQCAHGVLLGWMLTHISW